MEQFEAVVRFCLGREFDDMTSEDELTGVVQYRMGCVPGIEEFFRLRRTLAETARERVLRTPCGYNAEEMRTIYGSKTDPQQEFQPVVAIFNQLSQNARCSPSPS
jgi:hypothetical protein